VPAARAATEAAEAGVERGGLAAMAAPSWPEPAGRAKTISLLAVRAESEDRAARAATAEPAVVALVVLLWVCGAWMEASARWIPPPSPGRSEQQARAAPAVAIEAPTGQ
jgi:hypothetical protein